MSLLWIQRWPRFCLQFIRISRKLHCIRRRLITMENAIFRVFNSNIDKHFYLHNWNDIQIRRCCYCASILIRKNCYSNERQALDRFVEKYKKFMNLFFISHSIANGMQILSWGVLTWFGCLWFFYRILLNYAQLNEIMFKVFANLLFDVIHLKLFLCNCLLTN